MTYGVKRSRVLIEQHAPWFSLANYKKLIGASPLTWYLQFASRIDLHRMRSLLLGPHQSFLPAFSSAHASLTELIRRVGVLDRPSCSALRLSQCGLILSGHASRMETDAISSPIQ